MTRASHRLRFAWVLVGCVGLIAAPARANLEAVPGKTFAPGPFDSVYLTGVATVRFLQGDRDELFVEGDASVLDEVDVELEGRRLVVRNRGSWKFWRSAQQRTRMVLVARDLRSLKVSGAANFVAPEPVTLQQLQVDISGAAVARFDKLQTDRLVFSVSGAGDGHFTGRAPTLTVHISGKGDFYGADLESQQAKVSISGLGKARLWVHKTLDASITGIGTVEYFGTPVVNKKSSGVGRYTERGPRPTPVPPPSALPPVPVFPPPP